jgi:hypothetical protein
VGRRVRKPKLKHRKREAPTIRVESSCVYAVPYSFARSYFDWEIENEGRHRSRCTPIVLSPKEEAGGAGREWAEKIFAAMDEVRRTHARETIEMPGLVLDETRIDVGLIDIPVTFKGDFGRVTWNMRHWPARFFEENLRYLGRLIHGTFHDQMTLATVLHMVRPDGTPEVHYHNVIFGVRREFRPGRTLVGPLDFSPMLAALTKGCRLAVTGSCTEGWKVGYG